MPFAAWGAPLRDAVVITGCGWVTPWGAGTIEEVLSSPGRPPVGASYWPVGDAVLAAVPGISPECRQDPGAHLAAAALEYARRDAGLAISPAVAPADRVGMVLGCALAGQSGMIDFANDVRAQSARFVSPIRFPQTVGNYIAGALARGYDIRGPNATIACGIASGLEAVAQAQAILLAGKADMVYAGGVDRLTPRLAVGMAQQGVVLSDGACWFVLERASDAAKRGARILAVLCTDTAPQAGQPRERPLCSTAGFTEPGSVHIESWTGRCLAALGAAAIAAAIGAARGLAIPCASGADPTVVVPRASGDETVTNAHVIVSATSDGGSAVTMELAISTWRPSVGRCP